MTLIATIGKASVLRRKGLPAIQSVAMHPPMSELKSDSKKNQPGTCPEGWTPEGWKRYLTEYNKRMKRLHREARGDNMSSPPEPDYE